MGVIVTSADFATYFEISKTIYDTARIDAIIARFEKSYIYQLLGVTMGTAFIADLSSYVPQDADYLTIFNPIIDQDGGTIYESKGIKDILKAAIFYHYITERAAKVSQSGVVTQAAEVANVQSFDNTFLFAERKFNEMLDSWETVQWYCLDNAATYPDFKGVCLRPKYSALF